MALFSSCSDDETSSPLAVAPPTLPQAPTVAPVSARAVGVSWTAADAAPALVVERKVDGEDAVVLFPRAAVAEILDYGLDPETAYSYRLCHRSDAGDADDGASDVCSDWVDTATPSTELPAVPTIDVPYQGEGGADDLFLFVLLDPEAVNVFGAMLIADRQGRVVWEHASQIEGYILDTKLLSDGTLLFTQFADLRLMDLHRRPIRRFWQPVPGHNVDSPFDAVTVQTNHYYHHDVDPFGDDALMALTYIFFPYPETGQTVMGDGVVIIDRETGEEIWSLDLADYYDHKVDLCEPCFAEVFFGFGQNWTHANALWFDAVNSHIYINIRNLDRILVVEYPSGDVVREIGDDGATFAHTHDPEYLPDGSILLFDNGLHRPGGEEYSRVLQFQETPNGLETVWEYRETPDFYAPAWGDANRLPNGNTLIADGFGPRIVEVSSAGDKVWELGLTGHFGIYKSVLIKADALREAAGQE